MSVFNSLKELEDFLVEEKKRGKLLSEIYEAVQETPHLLERLYLMVTAGVVFVKAKEAGATEIMKDLIEMLKAVKNPMKGLFVRYYALKKLKDILPDKSTIYGGYLPSHHSNSNDSIIFLLQNLFEMNRLWIRMQHLSPRDKGRHRSDRKELSVVVGENLIRLSNLESVNIEVYQSFVLPRLLALIHNCKDPFSQQYLMDSIIQVFPYEYHVRTVNYLLETCAGLHNAVDTGTLFVSLMERLSISLSTESAELNKEVDIFGASKQFVDRAVKEQYEITPLTKLMELEVALLKMCVKCYPEKLEHVESILDDAFKLVQKQTKVDTDLLQIIYKLLASPLEGLALQTVSMKTFFALAEYLSNELKEKLARDLLLGLVKAHKKISSLETIEGVAILIKPLLQNYSKYELEEVQVNISKLIHMIDISNCEQEFVGLMKLKELFVRNDFMETAIPVMVWTLYKLARKASNSASKSQAFQLDLFETACSLCEALAAKRSEEAVNLLLQGVTSLDLIGVEGGISGKFMAKALSLYQSKSPKLSLIVTVIGSLERVKTFARGEREGFNKKVLKLCMELKAKEEQCKALLAYSHLICSKDDVFSTIIVGVECLYEERVRQEQRV
eukprot:TRINITY_DN1529_c0_g6_i1.p1 TRINITY_DN1529_c0_g6~~TRINITY_DN1529_c0_g6_i1.p1  ORF type:complete len:615 (+),score=228.63 TRINITY_DN1529_c0_g6_i1:426-2270(+)